MSNNKVEGIDPNVTMRKRQFQARQGVQLSVVERKANGLTARSVKGNKLGTLTQKRQKRNKEHEIQ